MGFKHEFAAFLSEEFGMPVITDVTAEDGWAVSIQGIVVGREEPHLYDGPEAGFISTLILDNVSKLADDGEKLTFKSRCVPINRVQLKLFHDLKNLLLLLND